MADLVLSPMLQVIFDRLASPVLQKIGDMWDLKENFQKLRNVLVMVRAVLEDAEEKEVSSKAVRIWFLKLRDAAYDAEDLLDRLAAECPLMESEKQEQGMLGNSASWNILRSSRLINAEKVRKTLQVLQKTAAEGLNFHLKEGSMINRGSGTDRRETSSFIIEPEIYGREEDKEKIVKMLLSCETTQEENVSFIPIIGLGGLGKTTLAQLAYNDERVIPHFDIRTWVFVSDAFNVKMIMKSVIRSAATKDKCDFSEMDALQSTLWNLLHKRRYLIVLDDVWTEDQDEWDKLRPLLRRGVNGSKIIVTTRSRKVAFMLDSPTFPYFLEGLPEDDCWALFKQRAFRRGEDKEYPNLLPIGKEIVKKCGGVPLAAKTLGSLMRFKREEREWLIVQNSELWNLDVRQSGILPAVRLSYHHLPSNLKGCFAFCSIFPRNYEIQKEKLIRLWMAEGFIQSDGGIKQPEDIGNECFNDLLWMSFFQEAEKCDANGAITGYKMHDIIYALAQSVAGKEYVILEHGSLPTSCERIRHSSVVSDFRSSTIPDVLFEAKRLRTLLLFLGGGLRADQLCKFYIFSYLRVLDLNGSGLTSLYESIDDLLCLRYLDLSYTRIEKLPNSIGYLSSLQTLNLIGCYNLMELPNLAKMSDLRHLNITGCEELTSMLPASAIRLFCLYPSTTIKVLIDKAPLPGPSNQLQTLPMIVVGGLLDLVFLGRLNLRGELHITQLENVRDPAWTKYANMMRKENLESLGLYWGTDAGSPDLIPSVEAEVAGFQKRRELHPSGPSQGRQPDPILGEEVIKGLKPHQNLKRLIVKGYPGIKFPHWTLPNLIEVDLIGCKKCECLPALGNLPLLKALSLCGMHAVKCIGNEFYCKGTERPFSSLKELTLKDFPNLEEWLSAGGRDTFCSVSKLIVNKCPKLSAMPLFLSLQHLELRDCAAILFSSIENVSSLKTLVIEKVPELLSLSGGCLANNSLLSSLEIISCPQLRSLPSELGNLTALKSLTIRWCQGLLSLPNGLQNLKSLESLEISDCHSITSMPEDGIGGLRSLRTLSIENCSNLTSLSTSFQQLTSLEHLTIMYCPSLSSLPTGVQHLSSLQSLAIISCPEFAFLPEGLQSVTTLHCLEIRICLGLTALPEWIKDLASLRSLTISDCRNLKQLPEGLKLLTALQHLSIQDCPKLEERCKEGSGEDWPKIAHVPHKYIGPLDLRQSSSASSSSG